MKAYELLSSPDKWTQGKYARDAKGNEVLYYDKNAVCFCMRGALKYCYPNGYDKQEADLVKVTERYTGTNNIVQANDLDTTTYEQVIKWLREADV